jgi:hypothetical protein
LITICLVCFTGLVFPASKFMLCWFWPGKVASLWVSPELVPRLKVKTVSDVVSIISPRMFFFKLLGFDRMLCSCRLWWSCLIYNYVEFAGEFSD